MVARLGLNGWEAEPRQVDRLRVDPGQIGFWKGWQFRTYKELSIPVADPAVCLRFTSAVNFILRGQNLILTQGALRAEVFTGAVTPSGAWSALPVIGVNRMIPGQGLVTPYTSQMTVETGGQFTGGTAVDLLMVRTSAQNASAQNVGVDSSERGLPPGTYYIRIGTITGGLQVNDPAQGIYSVQWEERP